MSDPRAEEREAIVKKLVGFTQFHDRDIFKYRPSDIKMKEARPGRKEPSAQSFARIKAELALVNEQLADPNTRLLPDRYKALLTRKFQLEQMVDENTALSKQQEVDDFNQWILGRGKEQDHVRTPWYRTPLSDLPGAREYILQFVQQRFKFLEYIHSLELMGPKDIKEAMEYFRFIVRGKEDGKLNYLEEWSRMDTMKEMTRKYGKSVAEKLADWPIGRGAVLPTKDIKLLATDFRSYIQHHWEYDEDKRRALFETDGLREELLVRLSALQHHEDIKNAMDDYYNRVTEKTDLVVMNIRAFQELEQESRRLDDRFTALNVETEGKPELRKALENEYMKRSFDILDAQRAIKEKIRDLLARIATDNPNGDNGFEKVLAILSKSRLPESYKRALAGDDDTETLLLAIAREIEASTKMLDEATALSAQIMSIADDSLPDIFLDQNGNVDRDKIDRVSDLLIELSEKLVSLEVSPFNRKDFI